MIDEYDTYLAIANNKLSYYDFQKWMKVQREDIPQDIYDDIYNRGCECSSGSYEEGYEYGVTVGYDDGHVDGYKLGRNDNLQEA